MSRALQILVSCVLLFVVSTVAFGDEPKKGKESAEEVVRRAMLALAEDRIEDYAKEMHPTALKQLKELLLTVLKAAEEEGQERTVLRLFKGVRSLDEAAKLDDKQLCVSFLKGVLGLKPEIKEALAKAKIECLGHVMEGQDTAHVVVRMTVTVSDVSITRMDVITVKRTDSGWSMLLSGEFEGIVQSLKQKLGKKQ